MGPGGPMGPHPGGPPGPHPGAPPLSMDPNMVRIDERPICFVKLLKRGSFPPFGRLCSHVFFSRNSRTKIYTNERRIVLGMYVATVQTNLLLLPLTELKDILQTSSFL